MSKKFVFGIWGKDDNDNHIFKRLDSKYCRFNNKYKHGLSFDLNTSYFLDNSINEFPKRVQEQVNKIIDTIPKNQANYDYWINASPGDGFICFEEDSEGSKEGIQSVFLGQLRKCTYCYNQYNDQIEKGSKFIEYQKFYQCSLNKPLTKNEKIHISILDVTLQVQEVIKSTDDSITYKTNYTISTINDVESTEYFKKAQEEQKQYKIKEENLKKEEQTMKTPKYEEPYGIAKIISKNITIYAFEHSAINVMDIKTNNTIVLDKESQDNLIKFLQYSQSQRK